MRTLCGAYYEDISRVAMTTIPMLSRARNHIPSIFKLWEANLSAANDEPTDCSLSDQHLKLTLLNFIVSKLRIHTSYKQENIPSLHAAPIPRYTVIPAHVRCGNFIYFQLLASNHMTTVVRYQFSVLLPCHIWNRECFHNTG